MSDGTLLWRTPAAIGRVSLSGSGRVMRRREFIALLGGAATAWPYNGWAQTPPKRALIGFLSTSTTAATSENFSSFTAGLREFGYLKGRDYTIEERYADGNFGRLPSLAEELVQLKPDVILAGSTPAALATKRATATIPIVGLLLTDPVGMGLVESEARPRTNVTGILIRVKGLPGKQLETALELIAGTKQVGILVDPRNPSNVIQRQETEAAAARLGVNLVSVEVRTTDEIGDVFRQFVHEHVGVIMVFTDALFTTMRRQIAAFALASRLPTIFAERESVEEGGLISYGVSRSRTYYRAAYYVDRILKGEKPGDLPIEFPTKLELVINIATAKALGITVPPTLLARVDEVIE